MNERRATVLLLCAQAALLFPAPGLLPVWTDELFTLQTVVKTVPEVIRAVQEDIHPPLYYLMARAWPWHDAAGLRALSAVWALAATAVFAIFWRGRAPLLALALFALSPCLLLYGRMARSYSMQVALVLLAVALLERWVRAPGSLRWAVGGGGALVALLYTHYVPGAAIALGFVVYAWRPLGARRVALFGTAMAAAYAPWAVLSLDALGRWTTQKSYAATYALSGNPALEHLVKLGLGATSLAIGESFFGVSLLLAPVVLFLAARGLRAGLFPAVWIGVAAVAGYLVVSRWVSYAFVPARLLWLLPFLCLAVAAGVGRRRWLGALILVAHLSSAVLYFRRENFLNPGYAVPLREIVATLNAEAQPADVILLDPYNTDHQVIVAGLSGRTPHIVLAGRPAIPPARAVWIVRNTRDASPGGTTSAMEAEACAGRSRRDTLLLPYAPWQQFVLKAAGRPQTHFYRLTVCER